MNLQESYTLDKKVREILSPYQITLLEDVKRYYQRTESKIEQPPEVQLTSFNWYQNPGLLGFLDTYSKRVGILEGLKGEDRERVEEHEFRGSHSHLHNNWPTYNGLEEALVREHTKTHNHEPHPMVSAGYKN